MKIHEFLAAKTAKRKISMITCYDATSAKIVEETPIDTILIGDSVSVVVHGYADTTHATLPMMVMHTKAVAAGTQKFIVSDLPFLSYRKSLSETMDAVSQLICAGAQAVKLEGAGSNTATIRHIVQSGIPVMGHIGLTPQWIHLLGGHRVQGKAEKQANELLEQALALQEAGCFAIVLECIPATLAKTITEALDIPTIGIGAGPHTDGQVLVWHDLLGFDPKFNPKFLKRFADGYSFVQQALESYHHEVSSQQFPVLEQHSY